MARTILLISLLLFAGCSDGREKNPLSRVDRWAILLSYNPDKHPVSPDDLHCFRMVIFDPDDHPPLEWLKRRTIPIAYISVGEAESYRDYWPSIQEEPWILEPNPNWPKSRFVDPRAEQWQELLLEEIIPRAVEQGFSGVMLDTIDTIDRLAKRRPAEGQEIRTAMIDLVASIHDAFPDLLLLVNGGFSILSEIAPYLDGVVVEDITWMPDFEQGGFVRVPEEWSSAKVAALRPVMEGHGLPIFAIDYVDAEDQEAVQEALLRSRTLGYRSYLAEKELNQIYDIGEQRCD